MWGQTRAIAARILPFRLPIDIDPLLARSPCQTGGNAARQAAIGAKRAALWHKPRLFGGGTGDFGPQGGQKSATTHGIGHENPNLNIDFRFPNGLLHRQFGFPDL
jgi:hypothetical protein